eukprot:5354316-Prymnesium_polylepis.2
MIESESTGGDEGTTSTRSQCSGGGGVRSPTRVDLSSATPANLRLPAGPVSRTHAVNPFLEALSPRKVSGDAHRH